MTSYYARKIITEEGIINNAYLLVNDGKISDIVNKAPKNENVVSFKDGIIAPGLIDIHTHGGLGYETGMGSVDNLIKWSRFKLKHGVTGFLPTTPSVSFEQLEKALYDIRQVINQPYSNILGMHLEGPFFKKGSKIGAQNPDYVVGDFPRKYRDFIGENSDIIRYLALDPLHDRAREIIAYCNQLNIKVAAAHSEILYRDFLKEKTGFSSITHNFNGMIGLHHREPGLAYVGCLDQALYAEIICDGFHVAYPMLELFFKLKGDDKSILVTDSMLATGMAPGSTYQLGGIEVTLNEEGKVYKSDGGLAGSTLTMDKAVRNLVNHLAIPLEKAVQMASLNPAKLLGIDKSRGSLSKGKDADFIVLDDNLEVQATFIKGKNVFRNE
jgi:N-acetylglucosamine-6-phosphate deacetylase